jgi:hypothetical protein
MHWQVLTTTKQQKQQQQQQQHNKTTKTTKEQRQKHDHLLEPLESIFCSKRILFLIFMNITYTTSFLV